MKNFFEKNDSEILENFLKIHSYTDLADFLEIKPQALLYYLSDVGIARSYTIASLRKKSGGVREINAPKKGLRIVQRKIARTLSILYTPKPSVFAFVEKRSVIQGSLLHVGRSVVLNLDLSDFFHSISLIRIRGALMSAPYSIRDNIATMIARLCCYKSRLPQGSPSSPVISNIVARSLDNSLQRFARSKACIYSRYADDITFSSDRKAINTSSFFTRNPDSNGVLRPFISGELLEIIEKNGFHVNQTKTRVRYRNQRQEVTGLTVNKFSNVKRSYVKEIKIIVHSWNKYGLESTIKRASEHYGINFSEHTFLSWLNGKLEFLRQVKGRNDEVYQNLIINLCLVSKWYEPKLRSISPKFSDFDSVHDRNRKISSLLWVIDTPKGQGTGFLLQGVGLLTAQHVLPKEISFDEINIHKHNRPENCEKIWRIFDCPSRDVSVVEFHNSIFFEGAGFRLSSSDRIFDGQDMLAAGYPVYKADSHESSVSIADGRILRPRRIIDEIEYFTVSPLIYDGMSGGPIIEQDLSVIGIGIQGAGRHITNHADGVEQCALYLPPIIKDFKTWPVRYL